MLLLVVYTDTCRFMYKCTTDLQEHREKYSDHYYIFMHYFSIM
jgi:hypothetical protein